MKILLTLEVELNIPNCKKCMFLESNYGYHCSVANKSWNVSGAVNIMDATWEEPPDTRPYWCPLGKEVEDKVIYKLKDVIAYMNGTWGKDSVKDVRVVKSGWTEE